MLNVFMLNVVMMNVVMLGVVMLNVVILSVVAYTYGLYYQLKNICSIGPWTWVHLKLTDTSRATKKVN